MDVLEPSRGYLNNEIRATNPVMGGVRYSSGAVAVGDDGLGHATKRSAAAAGLESSPCSVDDVDDGEAREEKRRQPVKRACNECRQQKVRRMS